VNRPELHLFEPMLESFKLQTEMDFEWVLVDVLYDERKDYFTNMKLPFKVKHIPAAPNAWHEVGWPGVSTQYNKGIIYSDGELVFLTGDGFMAPKQFMERLWTHYKEGYFPLAWYFYDESYVKRKETDGAKPVQVNSDGSPLDPTVRYSGPEEAQTQLKMAYPWEDTKPPVEYDLCGYHGEYVAFEHRYKEVFKDNNREYFAEPWLWNWFFGVSSASLESLLQANGFNQAFDGDRMLLDCDMGSRLELLGYGPKLRMFRDTYLIRVRTNWDKWCPKVPKESGITIKCNLPLIWFNRIFARPRANETPYTDEDIEWIKNVYCQTTCHITELCRNEHKWQFPFEHKEGYPGHEGSKKQYFLLWKKLQAEGTINLKEERQKRLDGDKKYAEGTFI